MKPLLLSFAAITLLCHCAAPSGGGSGHKAALASATKEQPFVNSLGMKFVPVPGTKILMCTTETTVAQYQAAGMGYQAPPFPQGSNHPAVNISYDDAVAWCQWLSKKEGRKYRVTNLEEWGPAVGTHTYPWGNQWPPPNFSGNYMGQEAKTDSMKHFAQGVGVTQAGVIGNYRDNHVFTAPVGSYPPNIHGLHDFGGNAKEVCGKSQTSQAFCGSGCLSHKKDDLSTALGFHFRSSNKREEDVGFRVVLER